MPRISSTRFIGRPADDQRRGVGVVLAGDELREGQAEAADVGAERGGVGLGLGLGADGDRALRLAGLVGLDARGGRRQAEVGHAGQAVVVDEEVFGPDVAVRQPLAVREPQPPRRLEDVGHRPRGGQRPLPLDDLGQARAVDELGGEIGPAPRRRRNRRRRATFGCSTCAAANAARVSRATYFGRHAHSGFTTRSATRLSRRPPPRQHDRPEPAPAQLAEHAVPADDRREVSGRPGGWRARHGGAPGEGTDRGRRAGLSLL